MPFLWTLQRYIFREMGKTFLLTAVALTGILGLGGGVLEIIKLGHVTPTQLARLILVMMPLSMALTLPIAALFAASATYGRLAGDNEFVACRSSGINLLVLFLPAVMLGLGSAIVTFLLSNFAIPGMVRNLNEFLFADVASVLTRQLDSPQGWARGNYRITADESWVDDENPDRIGLFNAAFVERGPSGWKRFGTAREVRFRSIATVGRYASRAGSMASVITTATPTARARSLSLTNKNSNRAICPPCSARGSNTSRLVNSFTIGQTPASGCAPARRWMTCARRSPARGCIRRSPTPGLHGMPLRYAMARGCT